VLQAERLLCSPAGLCRLQTCVAVLNVLACQLSNIALANTARNSLQDHLPLVNLGMDSLSAVELANWSSEHFGLPPPATTGVVWLSMAQLAAFCRPRPRCCSPTIKNKNIPAPVDAVAGSNMDAQRLEMLTTMTLARLTALQLAAIEAHAAGTSVDQDQIVQLLAADGTTAAQV